MSWFLLALVAIVPISGTVYWGHWSRGRAMA